MNPHVFVWNVAFMARPKRESWWDWLTEPGWRHVCAFGYSAEQDVWLVIDPSESRMFACALSAKGIIAWMAEREDRITAVLRFEAGQSRAIRTRLGVTCVSAVKLLLGLDSGALRPKALFRDLVAQGGTSVFEDDDEFQGESSRGRPGDEGQARAGRGAGGSPAH